MSRKTRAQKAREESKEVEGAPNECTIPSPPTPNENEGQTLRNDTPSNTEIPAAEIPGEHEMPKSKSKKNKRSKKGKKAKAGKAQDVVPEVVENENEDKPELAESPEPVAALDGIETPSAAIEAKDANEEPPQSIPAERPISPEVVSVRMTRRQLAMAGAEHGITEAERGVPESGTNDENITSTSTEPVLPDSPVPIEPAESELQSVASPQAEKSAEEVAADLPAHAASVTLDEVAEQPSPATDESSPDAIDQEPEQKLENIRNDSVALTEALEFVESPTLASAPTSTLPAAAISSPVPAISTPEDPIDAIDALEDEIEEIGRIIPNLDAPLSPVKLPAAKTSPSKSKLTPSRLAKPISPAAMKMKDALSPSLIGRLSTVRVTPPSNLTNTAQPSATLKARIPPSTSSARSVALGRSTSIKTNPRPISTIAANASSQTGKDKAPSNLAPKKRPISLQFPTPPPPPKSTKQLTKATFTLPGEAVAAKLRAARQERLKREEEEAARKKESRSRPASKLSKPIEVKQTAASRARINTIGGVEPSSDKENGTVGPKRTGIAKSGISAIPQRSITGDDQRRSNVMGPPNGVSSANTAQKRAGTVFAANKDFSSSLSNPKRPSGVLSNTAAKRIYSVGSTVSGVKSRIPSGVPVPKPVVTAQDVVVQKLKGREVFNRDRVEKEAREQERREKDEAMRKAREEAAERGRQASRDWALKQKKAAEKKQLGESQGSASATDYTSAVAV